MKKFGSFARSLVRDEEGLTLIEYALGGALISVAAIVMLAAVGTGVNQTMSNIAGCLLNTGCSLGIGVVAPTP